MYKILKAEELTTNIFLMVVEAKRLAKHCLPGQFLIVRTNEDSERIPLTICDYDRVQWVITIGAFLTLGITSVFSLGVNIEQVRSSTMLKALAWVILIVELITNGIFVFFDFSVPVYVIINGLILLIFALIYNSIYRTKM